MTIEVGFQGSSKSNGSLQYFDIQVPTNGSSHKVESLHATNNGSKVTIPDDFVVSFVQLAAVPNGIKVQVHFESENVQLNETNTKVDLPGAGLALGNAKVSATV